MQVIQMVKNKKETSGNDLDWEFQVPGQCLPGVVCSRRRPRQWGAEKRKRGQVGAIWFVEKGLSCWEKPMFAAERCARIPLPRKLISTRKLDSTLATTRSSSSSEFYYHDEHRVIIIMIMIMIRVATSTGCCQKRERSVGTRLALTILGKRLGISLNNCFHQISGEPLLLPWREGEPAVGVQPRWDESVPRQSQKVIFCYHVKHNN